MLSYPVLELLDVYGLLETKPAHGGAVYWEGRSESFKPIPEAPYYVLSNDSYMSGWGKSKGKINTCVVPCTNDAMARGVKAYIESREDQKYIRIVCNKPRTKSYVLYSIQLGWIDRAREYSNIKPEYRGY